MWFNSRTMGLTICLSITIIFILINTDLSAQKSGLQHWKSKEIIGSVALIKAYDDRNNLWYPFGTGVLIDIDTTSSSFMLVTNRHIYVARDTFEVQLNLYMDSNENTYYKSVNLPISKNNTAFIPTTQDSDFVIIFVNRPAEVGINGITLGEIIQTPMLEYGSEVEFYGYPLYAQFGLQRNPFQFPIMRRGAIAYFANDASINGLLPSMYLLDGASYGGGSGSPVFVRNYIITDSNTIEIKRNFVGIISGHLPLKDKIEINPISQIEGRSKPDSISI